MAYATHVSHFSFLFLSEGKLYINIDIDLCVKLVVYIYEVDSLYPAVGLVDLSDDYKKKHIDVQSCCAIDHVSYNALPRCCVQSSYLLPTDKHLGDNLFFLLFTVVVQCACH